MLKIPPNLKWHTIAKHKHQPKNELLKSVFTYRTNKRNQTLNSKQLPNWALPYRLDSQSNSLAYKIKKTVFPGYWKDISVKVVVMNIKG
jgi:hypothetical protein